MVTNPRGAGPIAIIALAVVAGVVAVTAVVTIHPERDAASPRPTPAASALPEGSAASGPAASGPVVDAPPDVVAPEVPIGADWCPAGTLSIEIESADAATGHREAVLRAVNIGNAPCVLDGYPDVAIADVDDRRVPLEIVRGSSFMATDPAPHPIVILPGGGAASVLGWDTTDGRTTIGAVYVAAYSGIPRVALAATWDMTAETRIATTAWQQD